MRKFIIYQENKIIIYSIIEKIIQYCFSRKTKKALAVYFNGQGFLKE
jgi:hypothetical protein